MIRSKAYRTVSWKRYLLNEDTDRIKNFLEHRGNEVFYQVSKMINNATITNQPNITLLIHPNMKNVIKIDKKDFIVVLNRANEWFLKKEKYEVCSEISVFKKNIKRNQSVGNKKLKSFI